MLYGSFEGVSGRARRGTLILGMPRKESNADFWSTWRI